MSRKKVAIVGSGCSGIGALWALKSTDHEVHLYESASRLGGHTNTVNYEGPDGKSTRVDTGFIVLNTATYPNFINFLKHVKVPTVKTEMTFGVSRDASDFEWAGTSLSAIFAQRKNIFRPLPGPDWMTILGGSQQYIDAVMDGFPPERLHLNKPVTKVVPAEQGRLSVVTAEGTESFDHVILAVHGDEALEIVGPAATKDEKSILQGFRTSKNVAVLHSDVTFMPKRRVAWSAWNYMTESPFPPSSETSNIPKVCLTYWMNLLQHIPENIFGNVFVTLNPLSPPDPRVVQGIWEYSHPIYDAGAIRSQRNLPSIQNKRGISYCGAWTKYGFHEDGFSSGIAVAVDHLDAKLPFDFVDSTFSREVDTRLSWRNRLVRVLLGLVQMVTVLISSTQHRVWADMDKRIAALRKQQ